MSKLLIGTGTTINDGNGDTLVVGATKVNSNFNEIYSSLGNGTDLNIGVGRTVISTTLSGNVGLGTTIPTSRLTVRGNTSLETLSASGISTVGSLSIGSSQVISSGRELQNIASLDATTKATIETAISLAPNTFTDLSISGISTFTNGPILVGTSSSTGTASQRLQVTGGGYFSGVGVATGSIGVGITNPQGTIDIRTSPQWSGFNYGANLVIGGSRNNALGILDSTNSNPWAVVNSSGNLLFASMPALGITTSPPTEAARITTNRNLVIGSLTETGTASQRLQVTGGGYFSGSVGIGTTIPGSELHLQATQPTIRFNETDVAADNRNWNVTVWNREFYWQALNDAGTGGGNIFALTRSGNQIQSFEGRNAGVTWFEVDNSTQRVGIGTSIPGEKLQVDGNVRVGISTTSNYIAFYGTTGDQPGSYNHTYIGERIWDPGTERSELFLFKGNDQGPSNPGSDRIRLAGGQIRLDTYNTATGGAPFESVGSSTSIINRVVVHPTGEVGIGSDVLTGTASQRLQVTGGGYISGNLGVGSTNPSTALDVVGLGQFNSNGATFNLVGTDHTYMQFYPDGIAAGRKAYIGFPNGSANYLEIVNTISDGSGNISLDPGPNAAVLIDTALATGTASQTLQVNGGAYVSGNLGVGATNPTSLVHIGPGTVSRAQLEFSSGSLLTTPQAGTVEYDGKTIYATPSTSIGRGSIPITSYTSGIGSSLTLGSEATAQVLFPAANDIIILPVGTYFIDSGITFTRAAGSTTSASLNITLNDVVGTASTAVGTFSGMTIGTAGTSSSTFTLSSASIGISTVMTPTISTASAVYTVMMSGVLRITSAGSFQPRYRLSSNLVGASGTNSLNPANYFKIQLLDSSGTSVFTGGWHTN